MADYPHFALLRDDDVLTIQLIDPKLFDTATIAQLQEDLLDLVEREQPQRAVVDFSRVSHCSTAVINGLLRAKKRLQANGGQLKLSGMIDPIRDSYRMLNLDGTVFQLYNTLEDAIAAF